MIDHDDIRTRYQQACKFLDERGRRPFAANEALPATAALRRTTLPYSQAHQLGADLELMTLGGMMPQIA